ncbi:MAG: nicotinate-nucleotide diphosphorylase (carboxylating) [Legionellales bacterium]|nr:nicotinate-nucleotide diphosphorylase (carboxylating) [Legionellales bacterium]|tara:strand:- start:253 stop:1089 length:837 start_codon:yes stop_codon:yes gene_type:complete
MDLWPDYLTDESIKQAVDAALAEDIGIGDKTVDLLPSDRKASAQIITRENAILCGQPWVESTFLTIDPNLKLTWHKQDADQIAQDDVLLEIQGRASSILTAERTALNFLQLLSGTATLTNQYVELIKHLPTNIIDTRKTVPGLRTAQKYAVLCGGGKNHRIGLYDGILIKENHLAKSNIEDILIAAQKSELFVEIEVENLTQLKQAIDLPCDVIMLDNFALQDIEKAIAITENKKVLEASGNITIENVLQYAETGVQRIAIGAITKCITPIDLSLRLV